MELFLDSVNFDDIKAANELGFIHGLTTTPTFMHRHGVTNVDNAIVELSKIVSELHVEALGDTAADTIAEAKRLSQLPGLAKPLTFKIPMSNEGLKAASQLTKNGHKVNIHLVYTLNQIYMAAAAGAAYICPLVGRLHDQGHDSYALIEQAVAMIERYKFPSKLMVASVRHADHVRMAILCGAHAITVPWRVLSELSGNILTGRGIIDFNIDTKLVTSMVGQIISKTNPMVTGDASVAEAAIQMTKSKMGIVSVINDNGCLIGVLTDGDLRRSIDHKDLAHERVNNLMSKNPLFANKELALQDAVEMMREAQVDSYVVVDDQHRPIGILDIQDLLHEGITI